MSFGDVLFGFTKFSTWLKNKKKNTRTFFGRDLRHATSFQDVVVNVADLEPGDHILIPGSISYGVKQKVGSSLYYHHGVYVGVINGVKTVTDFGRENKEYPVFCSLDEFLQGSDGCQKSTDKLYKRVNLHSDKILPFEQSYKLADEMCGFSGSGWDEYSLLFRNCETYATFIKTRVPFSSQASAFQGCTSYNQNVREDRRFEVGPGQIMHPSARAYWMDHILPFGIGRWLNQYI